MRLTQWTDYALRLLMYCAVHQQRERPITISEVAQVHNISRSHLTKIVQDLAGRGLLETTRGRGGGMRLLRPAQEVSLGAVVRATETDFDMVECFNPATNACYLSSNCHLKSVLSQATQAFLHTLDGVTLADLVADADAAALMRSTGALQAPAPGQPTIQPLIAFPRVR